MDLTPYVDALRQELTEVAGHDTDESRALAERLVMPLQSATRLTLFAALTAAAAEINEKLGADTVDVRLRGRDPEFIVAHPPANVAPHDAMQAPTDTGHREGLPPSESPPAQEEGDGTVSRITFRLPQHLKTRVERAADRHRLSANAWLLGAVVAAVERDESLPEQEPGKRANPRFTGWVR